MKTTINRTESLEDKIARIRNDLAARTTDRLGPGSPASNSEAREQPCPICGGLGSITYDVPVDHPDFGKAFPCECRRRQVEQARLTRLFGETAPLAIYSDFTFESWDQLPLQDRRGKERARELAGALADGPFYADGRKRIGLVLSGERGTTKTSLATCILRAWTQRGASTMWAAFWRITQQVKATYSKSATRSYLDVIEALTSVDFLLVDDMGSGRGVVINEHTRDVAWAVINERYCRLLPTAITTNFKWKEFASAFDYALAERINQIYEWCDVGGRNLRTEE